MQRAGEWCRCQLRTLPRSVPRSMLPRAMPRSVLRPACPQPACQDAGRCRCRHADASMVQPACLRQRAAASGECRASDRVDAGVHNCTCQCAAASVQMPACRCQRQCQPADANVTMPTSSVLICQRARKYTGRFPVRTRIAGSLAQAAQETCRFVHIDNARVCRAPKSSTS